MLGCLYVGLIFKAAKPIEIQLVRPTEAEVSGQLRYNYGKLLSEKNGYKFAKTALLLSNVINADHQYSCLQTKAIFSSRLLVLIGVLA